MPKWYTRLLSLMIILTTALLIAFVVLRIQATNQTVRQKLPSGSCAVVDKWIDDDIGWLSDESLVIDSMDYFYEKTGVQPYLVITDNINGKGGDVSDQEAEDYLGKLYDSLYSDEGHMIFCFMEYNESEYIPYVYTGIAADSVIDYQARSIFLNIADHYYSDLSLNDDEYFSKIFTKSADDIMKDSTELTDAVKMIVAACLIIDAILVGGYIAYMVQKIRKDNIAELKDIIDTPLGRSPEEQELIKKYGEDE